MAKVLGGIRQKLSRAAEMAKRCTATVDASGIVDLGNLGATLQDREEFARLRTAGDDGDPRGSQIPVAARA